MQEVEECLECPELPYSTSTQFWSRNPFTPDSRNPFTPGSRNPFTPDSRNPFTLGVADALTADPYQGNICMGSNRPPPSPPEIIAAGGRGVERL